MRNELGINQNIEPMVMMDRLLDVTGFNGGDSGEKCNSDNDEKDV
jgi:hypothetical protein